VYSHSTVLDSQSRYEIQMTYAVNLPQRISHTTMSAVSRWHLSNSRIYFYIRLSFSSLSVCLSIYLWPYSPCGLGRFFSFLIYILGRTPWTGDQPGRYVHTDEHIHRINAYRHACLEWVSNHNPSVRADQDSSCLRPRGHWPLSSASISNNSLKYSVQFCPGFLCLQFVTKMYLFLVYLTTLPVAQTMQRPMTGLLINDKLENMW
jgi:hypothetical protein